VEFCISSNRLLVIMHAECCDRCFHSMVCQSVRHLRPAKTAAWIEVLFGVETPGGTRNTLVVGADPSTETGGFCLLCCIKTADEMKFLFGFCMVTHEDPRHILLDECPDGPKAHSVG